MKFSKILLITILSLLIPFYSTFCQNKFPKPDFRPDPPITGYIIKTNNDTIKCDFKKPLLGALKYRPVNSTQKFKKPSTDEVKEYFSTYDSTVYVALYTDTNSSNLNYLKRLEMGKICLYEEDIIVSTYSPNGFSGSNTNIYYYINKDSGVLKEIKSNTLINDGSRKKRKEYLLNLILDDMDLAEKFKNEKDFNLKTLRHYIHTYNTFKFSAQVSK
jgi:hypothetical protein